MQAQSTRLIGGFALLVVVWIITYWAWGPSEPRISFAMMPPESTDSGSPPVSTDQPERRSAGTLGPPASPEEPAVIPPEFIAYTVLPGDSLESISAKMFGNVSHAASIAQANPMMDPTRLKTGRQIRIPRDPNNVQGVPNPLHIVPPTPGPTTDYVVQSGDSLTSISKTKYGSIKYADLIYEANKDTLKSRDSLRVGQTLKLPAKPAGDQ